MQTKLTREELKSMPLYRLHLLDIRTKEEEVLVQSVINEKMRSSPEPMPVYRGDLNTDVRSANEEEALQAIIDQRAREMLRGYEDGEEAEETPEEQADESEEETPEDAEDAPEVVAADTTSDATTVTVKPKRKIISKKKK